LNKYKNYFCQLLKVHGGNEVRLADVHTAELLVPVTSRFQVEIFTEKLKLYKS